MNKHSIKVIAALIVFTVFAFYAVFCFGLNADTCACIFGAVAFIAVPYAFKDELEEWKSNGKKRG